MIVINSIINGVDRPVTGTVFHGPVTNYQSIYDGAAWVPVINSPQTITLSVLSPKLALVLLTDDVEFRN